MRAPGWVVLVMSCVVGCAARSKPPAPWTPRSFPAEPAADVTVTPAPICCGPDRLVDELGGDLGRLRAWLHGHSRYDHLDAHGVTLLHNLAAWGHADAVALVLDAGADVDARDRRGATALHVARGAQVVDALLRSDPDRDAVDRDGDTVLFAHLGDRAALLRLLEAGYDPNVAARDGTSLLSVAARHVDAEVVALLLERGASLEPNSSWATAFATPGREDVVEVLLAAGAADHVDALSGVYAQTIWNDHPAGLERLLALGIPPPRDLLSTALWSSAELAARLLERVDPAQLDLAEGLRVALEKGYTELAVALLRAGAPIDDSDEYRKPLSIAARSGDAVAVEALIAAGAELDGALAEALHVYRDPAHEADPGADAVAEIVIARGGLPEDDEQRERLLYAAVKAGAVKTARALLDAGVRPPRRRSNGATSMVTLALRVGDAALATRLLRAGADPRGAHYGITALHWAAARGGPAVVRALLRRGLRPAASSGGDASPAAWAAAAGDLRSLRLLVARGAPCDDRGRVDNFNGALAAASARGHLAVVKHIVERCDGSPTETQRADAGELPPPAPVHWAAAYGRTDVLRYFLGRGVDPDHRFGDRATLVEIAASGGHADAVRALFEAGAEPGNALFGAARAGSVELVTELLGRGVDPDETAELGLSALDVAVYFGQTRVVAALLEAGASPTADTVRLTVLNPSYELTRALEVLGAPARFVPEPEGSFGYDGPPPEVWEAVRALVLGRPIDETRDRAPVLLALLSSEEPDLDLIGELIAAGVGLRERSDSGDTPLVVAVRRGLPGVARTLVEAGTDPALRCGDDDPGVFAVAAARGEWELAEALPRRCWRDGDTAADQSVLALAARAGRREVVEALLARRDRDRDATLPLAAAATRGDVEVVELLLRAGAAIGRADRGGDTAMHAAAEGDSGYVAYALARRGAAVDAANRRGETPLHIAAARGHHVVARIALDFDADVASVDAAGDTPLHHAARSNSRETVALLLDRGADPRVAGADGLTPLHAAAAAGAERSVAALLAGGASTGETNAGGATALDLAVDAGSVGAVAALLDAPAHRPGAKRLAELLAVALERGAGDVAGALLDAGARCLARNRPPRPACLESAYAIDAELAVRVARGSRGSRQRSSDGWPLLHFAVMKRDPRVVRALLGAGFAADAEAAPPLWSPQTPLTLAIRWRATELVSLLVDAGGDPRRRLSDGRRAIDDATELGVPELLEALR